MSEDRIEITLGPDVGKKTFKDFAQARDWLNKEREFWNLFQDERGRALIYAHFRKEFGLPIKQNVGSDSDGFGPRCI
jgi:hypothetical protein